jgi:hypothetical protein
MRESSNQRCFLVLEPLYRQAKDSVERSHYQIIWLLAQGKRTETDMRHLDFKHGHTL